MCWCLATHTTLHDCQVPQSAHRGSCQLAHLAQWRRSATACKQHADCCPPQQCCLYYRNFKVLASCQMRVQQQCTSTPWSEKASSMAMPPLPTIAMRLAWCMRRARLSTVSLSLSTSTCLPSATTCTEHTVALLLLTLCICGAECSIGLSWEVKHLTFGRAPVQMQSLSYGCLLPSCRQTTLFGVSIRLASPMTMCRLGCCKLARSFSITATCTTHVSHAHPVIAPSSEYFRRVVITSEAFDAICDFHDIRHALQSAHALHNLLLVRLTGLS